MKRTSIKDIARQANVSHSTVSRALTGSPLISRETTERIRKIAQKAGYRPSSAARSLVTSRSGAVGVVVTNIGDPFVAEVVGGIEDAANDHDYSVLLANSNADPDREVKVVRSFEERRVDGIVVTASRVGSVYRDLLANTGVPIVLLNNQHPSEFLYSVMIDNVAASREATRHLISLGHRYIGYIGDRIGYQSDTERFAGYREALDQADIPFQPDHVVHGNGKPEGSTLAIRRLLAVRPRPTAVFCYNDMTALGALAELRERGQTVPDDMSLIGFDDIFFAQFTDPPLTTIRQPKREMGRKAMETLLTIIGGSTSERTITLPGELIVRRSTAPPKEIY